MIFRKFFALLIFFAAFYSAVSQPLPQNLELPAVSTADTAFTQEGETLEPQTDRQIIQHAAFTLCYRESYEQAEWAAYVLEKDELVKNADRSDNFRSDPSVITGSAAPEDYRGSGYDRGHLAPAADMAFSETAMSESFYMSNMSPQHPQLNRGMWSRLEAEGRKRASQYGRVYVITGPVLEKKTYSTIGINSVAVPEYYYKIFLSFEEDDQSSPCSVSAFIIPNKKNEGTFFDFLVSIDDVEQRTGLDFFHLLDDAIEQKIESWTSWDAVY